MESTWNESARLGKKAEGILLTIFLLPSSDAAAASSRSTFASSFTGGMKLQVYPKNEQ
jgi:hypothetical protein